MIRTPLASAFLCLIAAVVAVACGDEGEPEPHVLAPELATGESVRQTVSSEGAEISVTDPSRAVEYTLSVAEGTFTDETEITVKRGDR